MSQQWQERKRPLRLERRYEFADYDKLRDFLDEAADLSEKVDFYPDMGFGRDYVNVTIHADDETDSLLDSHRSFADELDKISINFTKTQD